MDFLARREANLLISKQTTTLHMTLRLTATTLHTRMQLPSTFCKAVWPLGVFLDPDNDLGGKLCETN